MSYLVKWQVYGYWDCVSVCYGYELVSIVRKDYSPSLDSRDEMEKKIVSRFLVLEAGSVRWKHLGQVTKIEKSPPGSHLKKGFVQFWCFGIFVCGEKMMRKDGNSPLLETGGRAGNTLYQLSLDLGSTWCSPGGVFTISFFSWSFLTARTWVRVWVGWGVTALAATGISGKSDRAGCPL